MVSLVLCNNEMNLEEKRNALLHKDVLRTYYVESAALLLLI
jgi:hypothetical protein